MRILFVEDDAMNRRVVKDMLGVADVEMAEAPEAETGLQMVSDNDYDLILMDLRMPGMDGLTAIRHIRARGDAKAKLAMVMSTLASHPASICCSMLAAAPCNLLTISYAYMSHRWAPRPSWSSISPRMWPRARSTGARWAWPLAAHKKILAPPV